MMIDGAWVCGLARNRICGNYTSHETLARAFLNFYNPRPSYPFVVAEYPTNEQNKFYLVQDFDKCV